MMIKYYKRFLILISSIFFLSQTIYAESFKVAYVDVNKVFTTSKPALALQDVLKSKFSGDQEKLKNMNTNLVSQEKQMQEIMKKSNKSGSDKDRLNKFNIDQNNFQVEYYKFQQRFQKYQDYATALLLNKANQILKDISDKGNYDLVLTSNQFVYAKSRYDVTDTLLAKLNEIKSDDLVKKLNQVDEKQITPNLLHEMTTTN